MSNNPKMVHNTVLVTMTDQL